MCIPSWKQLLLLGTLNGIAFLINPSLSATTISFTQITSNGSESPAAQLSAEVSDAGSGQVLFKFINAAGGSSIASRISEVYWTDLQGLLTNLVVDISNTSGGVNLGNIPANPGDLPSGNNVNFSAIHSAGRLQSAANGVDPGEMVAFRFNGNHAAIVSALASGDIRLGMHVISIGSGGQSESLVSNAVPEPRAILFVLAGVAMLLSSTRNQMRLIG